MSLDKIKFEKVEIDGGYRGKGQYMEIGAKIIINGRPLLDTVREIEKNFQILNELYASPGDYQHQIARSLYEYLTNASFANEDGGAAIFTCFCLVDGCWCLRCTITETDTEVILRGFKNEHRDWDYSELGEFRFDKKEYYKELEHLKSFMG